jgi:HAD superfamily hydrolase (TIGR01509 family)
MIDALIFDVDGTLAETEELHRRAFNEVFRRFEIERLWPDPLHGWQWSRPLYRRLLATTGGKERIADYMRRHLAIDPAPHATVIAELHAAKTRRYAELVEAGGLALREGIGALIADARQAGCRLAIASTTSRNNIEALCRSCWHSDATAIFPVIAAGDEVPAKKPAPDIYRLALRRLGLDAGHCVAIEDSRNGLLAAQAAGLRCVVSPSFYSGEENVDSADLLLQGFETIASLAALERALIKPRVD